MANSRLMLDGMKELRDALRRLPVELRDEAAGIVTQAAQDAKREIVAAYPHRTGNLRRGVTVTSQHAGPFGTAQLVKSNARHAHLYEYGSQVRRTESGANRGVMPKPPAPVFVPIVVRKRREMNGQLIALVQRAGFQVTGDA